MPKRDRNHELETLSQRAFESALPPSVVVRPIADDYGIDREVEVFVEGATTGLTFKVQLKATDKSGASRRIKRTSLDYWHSLDVPVLLVSFEARTRILRGRWVHSIGAEGPHNGAETITVHMDPTIDLQNTWAERLANDLLLIRAIRRGDIPSPTPIRVEIDEELDLSLSQTTAALLNMSRRTRFPMRATQDRDEAALSVRIELTRVRVSLPLQVASGSLHVEKGLLDGADPRFVAELALMLCSCTVATVNVDMARQWLLRVPPDAPWWAIPELCDRVVQVLAHPDTAEMLLQIHAACVENSVATADAYMVSLPELVDGIDDTVFDAYSRLVRSHLPCDWDGGRMSFNLSSLHRLRREFGTALEMLERAAVNAPGYLADPRYQLDLAACLWEVGRFAESANAYVRALELGADPHRQLPLLADSLMYAGQYQKALDALDPWIPNGTASDKAGLLRRVILHHVIEFVGLKEQERTRFDSDRATKNYREASEAGDLTVPTLLSLMRASDALHPRLWIHLVAVDGERVGFEASLITAVMMVNNPLMWVLTMLGALQGSADGTVLRAVIDQARYLCGDDFYEAALQFAADQDKEEGEFIRELVSAAYSTEPETFANHVRSFDTSKAAWVVDTVNLPASPTSPPFTG